MERKVLGKIRSKFLDNKSFHIGFQNRSPFSYSNQYAGDWTPPVGDTTSEDPSQWDTGEMDVLDAEISAVQAATKGIADIGEAVMKKEVRKKCAETGGIWKDGKCESGATPKNSEADYNVKKEFRKVGENVEEITDSTNPTTTEIKEDFDKQMCWSNGGTWKSKQGVSGGKCIK